MTFPFWGTAIVKVELVRIGDGKTTRRTVEAPDGADAAAVLRAAGVSPKAGAGLAVFGVRAEPETVLKDGDRLTVADPLICNPKAARAQRALEQGDVRVVTCGRHGGRRASKA